MHNHRLILCLSVALMLFACGEGSEEEGPVNEGSTSADTTAGGATGAEDAGGNVTADTALQDTSGPEDSGAVADTGGVADVAPDTAPDTAEEEDTHGGAVDVGDPDPEVTAYCDCMFLSCHGIYHQVWGVDELEARLGCLEEAEGLEPGEEGAEGNTLACRQAQCDEELCLGAAGLEVCVE